MELKKFRETITKLSQGDMAEMLGVSQSTYSRWERGKVAPEPGAIVKLASRWGVNVGYNFETRIIQIYIPNPEDREIHECCDCRTLPYNLLIKLDLFKEDVQEYISQVTEGQDRFLPIWNGEEGDIQGYEEFLAEYKKELKSFWPK